MRHPLPVSALALPALLLATLLGVGCATVKVEPIHITVDINIKVDQALNDFFNKPAAAAAATPAATPEAAPAPAPAPAPAATTPTDK